MLVGWLDLVGSLRLDGLFLDGSRTGWLSLGRWTGSSCCLGLGACPLHFLDLALLCQFLLEACPLDTILLGAQLWFGHVMFSVGGKWTEELSRFGGAKVCSRMHGRCAGDGGRQDRLQW